MGEEGRPFGWPEIQFLRKKSKYKCVSSEEGFYFSAYKSLLD